MSGFHNPIVGGGGSLVYPSIHSPNFVAGVTGWSINKDGTAQFFGLTITGGVIKITGSTGGLFAYDPSIGAGNLIGWLTDAGSDPFGNAVSGVIGAQNNATTAKTFITKNANLHFNVVHFTNDAVIGAGEEGTGTVPYPAPNASFVSPSQAGSTAQISLILLAGDKETAKGPFALLSPANVGGVSGQYYAGSHCWYLPGTGVDDGAAINALLALGITKFTLLPGVANITTPISSSVNDIDFGGSGAGNPILGTVGTVLKLAASSAAFNNVIGNSGGAAGWTLHDFAIDGNSGGLSGSNQPAGAWQAGIVLQNSGTDGRHCVYNVRCENLTGDGIVTTGNQGRSRIFGNTADQCNGFGFNLTHDSEIFGNDAGRCGIGGFLIQGGSNALAACKAWFAGQVLVSTGGVLGVRGVGASLLTVNAPTGAGAPAWDGAGVAGLVFSVANGWGNGFHWVNITGSSRASGGGEGSYESMIAQDCAGNGFKNEGATGLKMSGIADSCSNSGTSSGTTPNVQLAGWDIAANQCNIDGTSMDDGGNTSHQYGALSISAGSARNRINLQFYGTLNDGSNMPPLTAASAQPLSNVVNFRASGPGSFKSIGSAATWTPDPFDAEVQEMTVTSALTINAPALAGTNTTGQFLVQGMRLTLITKQDATGHAVTLNAVFKVAGSAGFSAAANAITAITFMYDGTNWIAVGT